MPSTNIRSVKIDPTHGARITIEMGSGRATEVDSSPFFVGVQPVLKHLAPNESIYREGDRADRIYRIISGIVRDFRHISHGRRQITEFHGPGDIFGFNDGSRISSADAIGPVSLFIYRWQSQTDIGTGIGPTTNEILVQLLRHIERLQQHAILLGRRSAVEKLAIFLSRQAGRTGTVDWVALGMNRLDIADYLGLTVESVSRAFSALERQALIEIISAREIKLTNPVALSRFDA
jgi:CRP/FNR family nitrogen fixation transcriptional regulator